MINIGRRPGNRAMTIITGIATGNMSIALAAGIDAVMAAVTGASDVGMIHIGRCPCQC